MTLSALIAQLTAATEEDQHTVFYDVLKFLSAERMIDEDTFERAWALRNAGAYLDAAMTLYKFVTEGWDFRLEKCPLGYDFEMWDKDPINPSCQFYNEINVKTAALAICLASVRAIESMKRGTE